MRSLASPQRPRTHFHTALRSRLDLLRDVVAVPLLPKRARRRWKTADMSGTKRRIYSSGWLYSCDQCRRIGLGCAKKRALLSISRYDSGAILLGDRMKRFVEGAIADRAHCFLNIWEDWIDENNPVHVIDVFVDELNLPELRFSKVAPEVRSAFVRSVSAAEALNLRLSGSVEPPA